MTITNAHSSIAMMSLCRLEQGGKGAPPELAQPWWGLAALTRTRRSKALWGSISGRARCRLVGFFSKEADQALDKVSVAIESIVDRLCVSASADEAAVA